MNALLLDTSSLFFRAHHALPPMNTSTGEPTAALYGFSVLLLKLLRELRPDGVAFARDLPAPTFRHAEYTEYKAGRPPVPDALRTQWRRLDELIAAFGAPTHAVAGFEADDVLATLARRLTERDADASVTIVSGDRDIFQLTTPRVRAHFVGARGQKPETLDAAAVEARYGVPPKSLPALFALVGEAADNLIGVAGVGMKTASKLVARYQTTNELIAHLDEVTPIKLRESLAAAADRVVMNEGLARLRDDLALSDPLVDVITPENRAAVKSVFAELEFKSLVARIDALP